MTNYLAENPLTAQNGGEMSSTVTTTTVTMLTTAVSFGELMAGFTLICVVLLGCLLLSKEVAHVGQGLRVRRLSRGLDIAVVPLLLAFGTTLVLRAMDFLGG